MSHYPHHLVAGLLTLVAALGVWALTTNRLIRSKLRLSILLLVAYVGLNLFLSQPSLAGDLEPRLVSIDHLLFALAVINLLVVVAINPLRADRIPERFPNIVQDAVIIGIFVIVATVVLREKFLTTSAVGAVVIGFALQDTLGNMFAGLAIQVEKPFRVGHWITVGAFEGLVSEITWRATKLRTKNGNLVVLPNNIISREAITNFSEPAHPTRLQVDVGASYRTPPNEVKAALSEALAGDAMVRKTPEPEIVIADFGDSAIVYRVKFWIDDFSLDDVARDRVRSAIYYSFRRRQVDIPFPIQVQYFRTERPDRTAERTTELEAAVGGVDLFATLSETARTQIVSTSHERLYAAGETIVREGEPGTSMFVICRGRARVTVGPAGQEVAVIEPGGYFGEMSLLTGEPRSATVSAIEDCAVLELAAETFRNVALADPDIVEAIGVAITSRREGLERTRLAAAAPVVAQDARRSFLTRVQQFLRLPTR